MKTNRWLVISFIIAFSLLRGPGGFSAPAEENQAHNFAEAKVVDRVILSDIERYYDLERIDAAKMFQKAMEELYCS